MGVKITQCTFKELWVRYKSYYYYSFSVSALSLYTAPKCAYSSVTTTTTMSDVPKERT